LPGRSSWTALGRCSRVFSLKRNRVVGELVSVVVVVAIFRVLVAFFVIRVAVAGGGVARRRVSVAVHVHRVTRLGFRLRVVHFVGYNVSILPRFGADF
jgi:hypothetical protein